MSHAMIDTSLPETRRDRRLYRDGSQRLTWTSLGHDDFATALKQAGLDKAPAVAAAPNLDLDGPPLYTKRDRLSVRSWRGFEGLAVTQNWRVDRAAEGKAADFEHRVQAGG